MPQRNVLVLAAIALALVACGGGATPTSQSTGVGAVSTTGRSTTVVAAASVASSASPARATAPAATATLGAASSPVAIPTTRATQATLGTSQVTPRASGTPVARKQYSAPPPLTIDPKKSYTARIKTSEGEIVVALNAQDAPITVNNFVFLAREGFYDGVIFHRVLPGFVIQGGDPTGTGAGGPGYKFADEQVKGKYEIGSIAMANSGPNTNGSQFFICEGQNCTTLPPRYNLFGKVIEGQAVVTKIANVPKTLGGDGAQSKPVTPVVITAIVIEER